MTDRSAATWLDRAMAVAGRTSWWASALLAAATLFFTLWWTSCSLPLRPLDNIEGEIAFEAARLHQGLALYVDPLMGAHDYGAVPSRYMVLYPPLFPAALSLFPVASLPTISRVIATLGWFGFSAYLMLFAPQERRKLVILFGIFLSFVWTVVLFSCFGHPDTAAVLLMGTGLLIATRERTSKPMWAISPVVAALLTLAVWTKPNVMGAAPGLFLGALYAARQTGLSWKQSVRALLPALAGVAVTTAAIVLWLQWLSHGVWLSHLLSSTMQGNKLALFLSSLEHRVPKFAGFWLCAGYVAWRARRSAAGVMLLGALCWSVMWILFISSKTGAAANYMMEPNLVALVTVYRLPLPSLSARQRHLAACAMLMQIIWSSVASIHSTCENLQDDPSKSELVAHARRDCGIADSALVISDEPGVEWMLNGRLIQTPFQTTHLMRAGRFPESLWSKDLSDPSVQCLVMHSDLLELPLEQKREDYDLYPPSIRKVLRDRFKRIRSHGGMSLYGLRH